MRVKKRNKEKPEQKVTSKTIRSIIIDAYGVVTGDPPSFKGGGNGSGLGGGSFTSCPLQ